MEKSHSVWKDELPKMSRLAVMQFAVGDSAPSELPPPPVGGIMFDSYKSDGSLDWRLRVDENGIFVNCLSYTRWIEVWPKAYSVLRKVSDFINGEVFIASVILQYVDIFNWSGNISEYRLSDLLNTDSKRIPDAIFDEAHLWHLHQGRFLNLPDNNGRILERVDFDGLEDENSSPIVKMDILLQHQFKVELAHQINNLGNEEVIGGLFEALHNMQKQIAMDFLSSDMCGRIGLNA